jgi:hypothetical protein
MDLQANVSAIVDRLDARWGVAAAWLFGSQTRTARPDSDIDLAVLFRRRPTSLELIDIGAELRELGGRPVDVVDLDGASPIVAYQALKNGRLVADNEPRRRIDFVAHLPGRYEDIRIVRREAEKTLLQRIAHGRT